MGKIVVEVTYPMLYLGYGKELQLMSKPKSTSTNPYVTYPLHLSHEDHAKIVEAAKNENKTIKDFILEAIFDKAGIARG